MNGRFLLIAAAESHGASNLRVFGSVARGEDGPDSDVDLQHSHLQRGDLDDSLGYDAVRARLIESGEAVKRIPAEVVATEPGTPWRDIGTMRDRLAHRYFDTLHSIVQSTVENDLRPLEQAVLPLFSSSFRIRCRCQTRSVFLSRNDRSTNQAQRQPLITPSAMSGHIRPPPWSPSRLAGGSSCENDQRCLR
ncbi:MAG: HepT-like ribonuclease domain-containing protein [Actinomycetes bacterium]